MSDAVLGIFGLAVLVGGVVLWQKFTSAVGTKATQTLLRPKAHKAGQELVSQKHEFAVSASRKEVIDAILRGVAVAQSVPAVKPGLYLAGSSDSSITFDYGSKVQTVFRMFIHVISTNAGASGSYEITNWLLVDGIVGRQKEMKQLIADIEAALRSVDPNARLR